MTPAMRAQIWYPVLLRGASCAVVRAGREDDVESLELHSQCFSEPSVEVTTTVAMEGRKTQHVLACLSLWCAWRRLSCGIRNALRCRPRPCGAAVVHLHGA
eukprot:15464439-Alexandrium_andersonii.AAC.1